MSFRPDFQASAPNCRHRPPCPGCPDLGGDASQLAITARLADLARAHGAALTMAPKIPVPGYRHRARLAVRGRAGSPKVGLFQAGSHRIADIPACLVHHPRINDVAQHIKQGIRATGLAPYADGPHRGLVRYVQVTVAPEDGRVQLVLVTNDESPHAAGPLLAHIQQALSDQLDGLFWNGHPGRDNRILGDHWARIAGAEALATAVGETRIFLPPDAFCQNNPAVYAQIADQVDAWMPSDGDVLELYAGVGALGLRVLKRQRTVTFNELATGSLRGLELGRAALPEARRAPTSVLPGAAGEQTAALSRASSVIVDPPRKGLDAGLAAAIAGERSVQQLVYISCGPEAFMADAQLLTASGRLALRELVVFDLFPWTGHVEVGALFTGAT